MGSSLSPVISNLFMQDLEEHVLNDLRDSSILSLLYVDDTLFKLNVIVMKTEDGTINHTVYQTHRIPCQLQSVMKHYLREQHITKEMNKLKHPTNKMVLQEELSIEHPILNRQLTKENKAN